MKKNNKGFTLIELLVVIAIIGLLSTLAVVSLNNARTKSRDARRVADIKQMQTALELYFTDESTYPDAPASGICPDAATAAAGNMQGCCITTPASGNLGIAANCTTGAGNITYMSQIPSNPTPNGSDYIIVADDLGGLATDFESYHITYTLEQNTGGIDLGLNTATPGGISDN